MDTGRQPDADFKGHRWFAAVYDLLGRGSERGWFGELRQQTLAGLSGDVLEIGAGTGANFAHYPEEARVIALEPDPYMLQRAEQRRRPNIELRQVAAEHLPFADASFDVVVSTLVLCTVADARQALAEARRVLRPGGELRFIEHVRGDGRLRRLQSFIQPVYGRISGGCNLLRDTERAIQDAGFAIDRIRRRKLAPFMPMIHGVAKPA